MSRLVWNGRQRVAIALGAVLVAVALPAAPAWGASSVSTDCTNLQATMNAATSGETIELTELCTVSNSGAAAGSFATPTASDVTIEGAAAGDGFDGTGVVNGPALHGAAPGGLTLRNLTFENYSLTASAAVTLQLSTGALPVIDHDSFVSNTDTSNTEPAGGGLEIFGVNTSCPYTGSLTISNSLFSGNVLVSTQTTNPASGGVTGAGASVSFECVSPNTANLVITGNTFTAELDPYRRPDCRRRGALRRERRERSADGHAVRERVRVELDRQHRFDGSHVRRRRRVARVGQPDELRRRVHRQLAPRSGRGLG